MYFGSNGSVGLRKVRECLGQALGCRDMRNVSVIRFLNADGHRVDVPPEHDLTTDLAAIGEFSQLKTVDLSRVDIFAISQVRSLLEKYTVVIVDCPVTATNAGLEEMSKLSDILLEKLIFLSATAITVSPPRSSFFIGKSIEVKKLIVALHRKFWGVVVDPLKSLWFSLQKLEGVDFRVKCVEIIQKDVGFCEILTKRGISLESCADILENLFKEFTSFDDSNVLISVWDFDVTVTLSSFLSKHLRLEFTKNGEAELKISHSFMCTMRLAKMLQSVRCSLLLQQASTLLTACVITVITMDVNVEVYAQSSLVKELEDSLSLFPDLYFLDFYATICHGGVTVDSFVSLLHRFDIFVGIGRNVPLNFNGVERNDLLRLIFIPMENIEQEYSPWIGDLGDLKNDVSFVRAVKKVHRDVYRVPYRPNENIGFWHFGVNQYELRLSSIFCGAVESEVMTGKMRMRDALHFSAECKEYAESVIRVVCRHDCSFNGSYSVKEEFQSLSGFTKAEVLDIRAVSNAQIRVIEGILRAFPTLIIDVRGALTSVEFDSSDDTLLDRLILFEKTALVEKTFSEDVLQFLAKHRNKEDVVQRMIQNHANYFGDAMFSRFQEVVLKLKRLQHLRLYLIGNSKSGKTIFAKQLVNPINLSRTFSEPTVLANVFKYAVSDETWSVPTTDSPIVKETGNVRSFRTVVHSRKEYYPETTEPSQPQQSSSILSQKTDSNTVHVPISSPNVMNVTVWDCGGQDEYQNCFPFLFPIEGGHFLIFVDVSHSFDVINENLRYWIHLLLCRYTRSQIRSKLLYVVLTHSDRVDIEYCEGAIQQCERFLEIFFGAKISVIAFSNLKNDDVLSIRRNLRILLESKVEISDEFPQNELDSIFAYVNSLRSIQICPISDANIIVISEKLGLLSSHRLRNTNEYLVMKNSEDFLSFLQCILNSPRKIFESLCSLPYGMLKQHLWHLLCQGKIPLDMVHSRGREILRDPVVVSRLLELLSDENVVIQTEENSVRLLLVPLLLPRDADVVMKGRKSAMIAYISPELFYTRWTENILVFSAWRCARDQKFLAWRDGCIAYFGSENDFCLIELIPVQKRPITESSFHGRCIKVSVCWSIGGSHKVQGFRESWTRTLDNLSKEPWDGTNPDNWHERPVNSPPVDASIYNELDGSIAEGNLVELHTHLTGMGSPEFWLKRVMGGYVLSYSTFFAKFFSIPHGTERKDAIFRLLKFQGVGKNFSLNFETLEEFVNLYNNSLLPTDRRISVDEILLFYTYDVVFSVETLIQAMFGVKIPKDDNNQNLDRSLENSSYSNLFQELEKSLCNPAIGFSFGLRARPCIFLNRVENKLECKYGVTNGDLLEAIESGVPEEKRSKAAKAVEANLRNCFAMLNIDGKEPSNQGLVEYRGQFTPEFFPMRYVLKDPLFEQRPEIYSLLVNNVMARYAKAGVGYVEFSLSTKHLLKDVVVKHLSESMVWPEHHTPNASLQDSVLYLLRPFTFPRHRFFNGMLQSYAFLAGFNRMKGRFPRKVALEAIRTLLNPEDVANIAGEVFTEYEYGTIVPREDAYYFVSRMWPLWGHPMPVNIRNVILEKIFGDPNLAGGIIDNLNRLACRLAVYDEMHMPTDTIKVVGLDLMSDEDGFPFSPYLHSDVIDCILSLILKSGGKFGVRLHGGENVAGASVLNRLNLPSSPLDVEQRILNRDYASHLEIVFFESKRLHEELSKALLNTGISPKIRIGHGILFCASNHWLFELPREIVNGCEYDEIPCLFEDKRKWFIRNNIVFEVNITSNYYLVDSTVWQKWSEHWFLETMLEMGLRVILGTDNDGIMPLHECSIHYRHVSLAYEYCSAIGAGCLSSKNVADMIEWSRKGAFSLPPSARALVLRRSSI